VPGRSIRANQAALDYVVEFLPVRWRSQACWLLHVLKNEKVMQCVDRGAPNLTGKKGKATLYRYLYPME
jgi:hypothetical protein